MGDDAGINPVFPFMAYTTYRFVLAVLEGAAPEVPTADAGVFASDGSRLVLGTIPGAPDIVNLCVGIVSVGLVLWFLWGIAKFLRG